MKAFLYGAALTLALTSLSFADDAFRCPTPGTVFTFSSGNAVGFDHQDGFNCVIHSSSTGTTLQVFLGVSSVPELAKNHAERLFPFKVGDQIEFDRTGTSSNASGGGIASNTTIYYHDVIKVLRQERLVTKAGTFDTYVIERKSNITNRGITGAWTWTFWWAPQFGYLIKAVEQTHGGYGTDITSELVSITMPSAAGPPVMSSTSPPAPTAAPAPPVPTAASTAPSKPSPASPATQSPSTATRLEELKSLLDRKLISPSEYEAKRKAILDAL